MARVLEEDVDVVANSMVQFEREACATAERPTDIGSQLI
jgi:hypothetical protein